MSGNRACRCPRWSWPHPGRRRLYSQGCDLVLHGPGSSRERSDDIVGFSHRRWQHAPSAKRPRTVGDGRGHGPEHAGGAQDMSNVPARPERPMPQLEALLAGKVEGVADGLHGAVRLPAPMTLLSSALDRASTAPWWPTARAAGADHAERPGGPMTEPGGERARSSAPGSFAASSRQGSRRVQLAGPHRRRLDRPGRRGCGPRGSRDHRPRPRRPQCRS